jgi:hypothetical protein
MDEDKTNPIELTATLCAGKYTVEFMTNGRLRALRYGKEWRDLTGDGMVLALLQEVHSLREKNTALQTVVNEAARCFFGPDETKPGTWGHAVAWKLQELSTPPAPTKPSSENRPPSHGAA